jgi:hypothetical protein
MGGAICACLVTFDLETGFAAINLIAGGTLLAEARVILIENVVLVVSSFLLNLAGRALSIAEGRCSVPPTFHFRALGALIAVRREFDRPVPARALSFDDLFVALALAALSVFGNIDPV